MTLTSFNMSKKLQTTKPYIYNAIIGTGISTYVFTASIPAAAFFLFIDRVVVKDFAILNTVGNALPEWMGFCTKGIKIGPITILHPQQINAMFFISLAFATVITAATIFMLYKMHKNSKEIGEDNISSRVFDIRENETISYSEGIGTKEDPIYVSLHGAEESVGCIVTSASGKKIFVLEHISDEEKKNKSQNELHATHKVVCYVNSKKPEKTTKDFKEDFFKDGQISRKDVTVYTTSSSKLVDILIEQQKCKQK